MGSASWYAWPMSNLDTVENAIAFFTNREGLQPQQCDRMDELSESLRFVVGKIFELVPPGAERTLALRSLKDCRARCIEAICFE